MHIEIWEVQGNKNGRILAMKKLARQSHSAPNFKAYGPDGIPMEFFKALISGKNDSVESSANDSNISSIFKCFKALINRIWNNDFQKSWNKTLIISIHKKDYPSDCNNYRSIFLIHNGLKIIAKLLAN